MGLLGDLLNDFCESTGLNDLADEVGRGIHEAVTGSSNCNNEIGNSEQDEKEKE